MKISSFFFGVVMAIVSISLSTSDECTSIQLTGHLNKKNVPVGGTVKVTLNVRNTGVRDFSNANVRLDLPSGTQYVGSSMLPKIKSHLQPINLQRKIYWTDLTLRKGKTQKLDIKVRKCCSRCDCSMLLCLSHLRCIMIILITASEKCSIILLVRSK